jgi:hypothetical protein
MLNAIFLEYKNQIKVSSLKKKKRGQNPVHLLKKHLKSAEMSLLIISFEKSEFFFNFLKKPPKFLD